MRISKNWLTLGLLVVGLCQSLTALAQSDLRTPNCKAPGSPQEKICCDFGGGNCKLYGFKTPPLRVPNCETAEKNSFESGCCGQPDSCEPFGFERPPLRAPNCESARANSNEANCCRTPGNCAYFGFERPPIRTANCGNPGSEQEQWCCNAPAKCEELGFEPVAAKAEPVQAKPVVAKAEPVQAKPPTELPVANCENPQSVWERRCCNLQIHAKMQAACELKFKTPILRAAVATSAPVPKTPVAATQAAPPKVAKEAPAAIPVADPGRIKRLTKADVAGVTSFLVRKPILPAEKDARIAVCIGSRDPVIRHNFMVMLNAPIGQVDDPNKSFEVNINSSTSNYDNVFDSFVKSFMPLRESLCVPGEVDKAYADYVAYQDKAMQAVERMRRERAEKEKVDAELAETGLRTPNCDNPTRPKEKLCCTRPTACAATGFKQPPLRVPNCDNPTSGAEKKCCDYGPRCDSGGFERPPLRAPNCSTASPGSSELGCCQLPSTCKNSGFFEPGGA